MFEKFNNPAFWVQVKNNPDFAPLVAMIKEKYEENKVNPIPVLTYNDYKAYERHGERAWCCGSYHSRRDL